MKNPRKTNNDIHVKKIYIKFLQYNLFLIIIHPVIKEFKRLKCEKLK